MNVLGRISIKIIFERPGMLIVGNNVIGKISLKKKKTHKDSRLGLWFYEKH